MKKFHYQKEDKTVLIDGKHMTHPNTEALKICDTTADIRPKICVRAVHFDADKGWGIIEWDKPENTMITAEQFEKMFGHVAEDHADFFMHVDAENENWQHQDRIQTARIEAKKKAGTLTDEEAAQAFDNMSPTEKAAAFRKLSGTK
jgi:hypothetical protein